MCMTACSTANGVRSGSGALATRMPRLIVSGMWSIPEMSSCSFISVSQHEASVRFIPVFVWYLSHHFSRSLRRQQCQGIVERPPLSFPASSVGTRFTLGFAATARSSVNNVPSIVPTKHVSANSQTLYSSSAPPKAVACSALQLRSPSSLS